MGKNARFGPRRTIVFMCSRALLVRETQPDSAPPVPPSAVARPHAPPDSFCCLELYLKKPRVSVGMCQQATVHVEPRTAAARHPAGMQTPRHPRLIRSRPPLLAAGLFLLAGTILKMGQNARFGSRRTIAFMWSCALLLCETHPAGRLRAARAPSAVARPARRAPPDSFCCLELYS